MRTVKIKLEPNQDDASDHFLSAKRLHTRPSSCSTRARLVAPCNYNSTSSRHTKLRTFAQTPLGYGPYSLFLIFGCFLYTFLLYCKVFGSGTTGTPQIDLFWVVPERYHRPRSPQEGPFPGWVPVLIRKKTQMGLLGGLRKSGYF